MEGCLKMKHYSGPRDISKLQIYLVQVGHILVQLRVMVLKLACFVTALAAFSLSSTNSLTIFPYPQSHLEKNKVMKEMEECGKKFMSSAGHKNYDRMTVALRRSEGRFEIESDVYVDFETYYQLNPLLKFMLGQRKVKGVGQRSVSTLLGKLHP